MSTRSKACSAAAALVFAALVALPTSPAAAVTASGGNGRIAVGVSLDGPSALLTMNADGSQVTGAGGGPLIDAQRGSPSWSPDGGMLAYNYDALNSDQSGSNGLYTEDVDTGEWQKVPGAEDFYQSDWSPDGMRLAAVKDESRLQPPRLEVFTFNTDGTDFQQVTSDGHLKSRPKWSPGGSRIAYSGGSYSTRDLWVINSSGGTPTRLTTHSADDEMGSWSPGGSKIVFSSNRSGNYEIYTLDVGNPTAVVRLTNTADDERTPTWSPDGTKIAYSRDVAGAPDLWVLNAADGSGQTALTRSGTQSDLSPAWAPARCQGQKATKWGTGAGETINGTSGNDIIAGLEGNDVILGGAGNDMICGGTGNDTIIGGGGDDVHSGGSGTDAASYSDHTAPVTADLDVENGDDGSSEDGTKFRDTIKPDVESVIGGSGGDVLTGNSRANVLSGGRGDDTLVGGSGTDTLNGNIGADIIDGGADVDTAIYTSRTASVTVTINNTADDGESGENDNVKTTIENVTGSKGNDTLTGNGAANRLTGGSGNDTLTGSGGNDTLTGNTGTDKANGGTGTDTCTAETETTCEN